MKTMICATSGDTGGLKTIGNVRNDMRFHGLGDAPGAEGRPRIGKAKISMHVHGLQRGAGVAGAPENCEKLPILCISIAYMVLWGTRAAPEPGAPGVLIPDLITPPITFVR